MTDAIKKICGDLDGDFELTQLVLQLMSYISSEKPDVCEKGSAFFLGYKKRPVKIRMWDVGYHATIEHRDPQSNNKKIQKDGTHQSPRAHMRRGHWHTYLYGKGKKAKGSLG